MSRNMSRLFRIYASRSRAGVHSPATDLITDFKRVDPRAARRSSVKTLEKTTMFANRNFNIKPASAETVRSARENFSRAIELSSAIQKNWDENEFDTTERNTISTTLSSYAVFLYSTESSKRLSDVSVLLRESLTLNPDNEQAKEYLAELEYSYPRLKRS